MIFQHALCGCGIFVEFGGRAGGPGNNHAAAVGARMIETLLCALDAERALERADAGLRGIRGKIAIAALAVGS